MENSELQVESNRKRKRFELSWNFAVASKNCLFIYSFTALTHTLTRHTHSTHSLTWPVIHWSKQLNLLLYLMPCPLPFAVTISVTISIFCFCFLFLFLFCHLLTLQVAKMAMKTSFLFIFPCKMMCEALFARRQREADR